MNMTEKHRALCIQLHTQNCLIMKKVSGTALLTINSDDIFLVCESSGFGSQNNVKTSEADFVLIFDN